MPKIIVSLTSYPQRIGALPRVIATLNNQTVNPDKIVVYLTEEEFQDCKSIVDIDLFAKNNAEIHWVEKNYKPYNKFFYAFKEYKDDIVITIDDDVEYGQTLIEDLLSGAEKFPNAVISRRARLITSTDEGDMETYNNWPNITQAEIGLFAEHPSFSLIALGVGGVLYHPNQFSEELFRADLFTKICPYTDDLWLKLHQELSNIPVVVVPCTSNNSNISEISSSGLYANINQDGGNQIAINNIIDYCESIGISRQQITDHIFSTGRVYSSNWEKLVNTYLYGDNYESIHKHVTEHALPPAQLIELIHAYEYIYIYGAGIYGKRLLSLIFNQNTYKKVKFIETEVENPRKVFGIDVLPVTSLQEELKENSAIILAGTDTNAYSMAAELEKADIHLYYSFGEGTKEYLANIENIKHLNMSQRIGSLDRKIEQLNVRINAFDKKLDMILSILSHQLMDASELTGQADDEMQGVDKYHKDDSQASTPPQGNAHPLF